MNTNRLKRPLDYEISGGDDKPYEAVIWIDRFHCSDEIAHSIAIWRVASNCCHHMVLRFHWLCQNAE